uniref:Putative methyltransferase n=1 Tax=viral metagenome TaxID=1070528 RepID=A0A6H1ZRI1_9ZZZZ
MTFEGGNKADGKHYWLTPPELLKQLNIEFHFDFDPCPFPKPENFDGLTAEWGKSNYVNPPFGSYRDENGKKRGPTAWAKKAIKEFKKGKRVVLVYPIDKWIHMLLAVGAKVRNLKDIRWHAIEDGEPGPGTGRWVALFILEPENYVEPKQNCDFTEIKTKYIENERKQRKLF